MEDLSEITGPVRAPITIRIHDYLRDHLFRDSAVFPAVEAMSVLAASASSRHTGLDVRRIGNARFLRFLDLPPGVTSLEAAFEAVSGTDGSVTASLLTVKKSGKTTITRKLEHAFCTFGVSAELPPTPPLDASLALDGICVSPEHERIYRDLVPFGPAFQNIRSLHVTRSGALAMVSGGAPVAHDGPLGSPFPLDASFHAACVWGQRFGGIVGFPVEFGLRIIHNRTQPGTDYIARIFPTGTDKETLLFDIFIYNEDGLLHEEVRGLAMRDVSGKTILPPVWIADSGEDPLEPIRRQCADLCVIELGTVSGACEKILSGPELERSASMREKRMRSFCSARLALKTLSRRASKNDMKTLPAQINTMAPDGRPLCPRTDGGAELFCTASHDSRFAIAALSDRPVGIDVEEITERVLKGQEHYMQNQEIALVRGHPLGEMKASIRVWSVKEAVSKASGLHIVEAWRRSSVQEIKSDATVIALDGTPYHAAHAVFDGHIVTIISL
ncbi:MAG: polyketide synthase dehydratase domain-containing protein [Spirochaetes bacterium]|nr:polyketide synthase dehydratase domain-containing protein [Spirochaetota bacterium]